MSRPAPIQVPLEREPIMSIRLTTAAVTLAASCFIPTTALAVESLTNGLVPNVAIAPLDLDWLREDDARRTADGLPLRFAVPHDAFVTPGNDGLWDRTQDGWLRWRMAFQPRAPHINFGFEHWNMPTAANCSSNRPTAPMPSARSFALPDHGELWTPVVRGDEIVLTITVMPTAWPSSRTSPSRDQRRLSGLRHGAGHRPQQSATSTWSPGGRPRCRPMRASTPSMGSTPARAA